MNLRHIEVFHAVYVNGSVSQAARALNVSQPSVSKVLRHAETGLGFPLFRRAKGRLTATDEAHELFREVDEIHGRVGSLKRSAENIRKGGEGHVRLAVLPGFGLGVAPMAVARFRAQHPSVSFDIQTLHHADILNSLQERDCDLAVAYDPPCHPRLAHVEIGRSELVLLYPESAIPNAPPRLDMRVLEQHEFISLAQSGPMGNLFNRQIERLDLKLREVVQVRTLYVAAALVRFGAGVAIVDEFTAQACMTPEMSFRPLNPPLSFGVHCIYLEDHPLSRLTREFMDVLASIVAKGIS